MRFRLIEHSDAHHLLPTEILTVRSQLVRPAIGAKVKRKSEVVYVARTV